MTLRAAFAAGAVFLAGPALAQAAPHAAAACAEVSDSRLPADFSAWASPAHQMQASAGGAADMVPLLPVDRPAEVRLLPAGAVALPVAPGQARTPDKAHAGLVRITIPQAGTWRLAASTPVWIDVVSGRTPVASSGHGRMAPCTSLRKVVEFPLAAGDYLVQLSGNPGPDLRLLLTRKP